MLITLRVVFTALALCTCGLLSWAATLRIAILRKRASDWLLFGAVLLLGVATLIILGEFGAPVSEDPDAPADLNAVDYMCLAVVFALSVGSATHFLIADIRHFRRRPEPVWGPFHSMPVTNQPRMYGGQPGPVPGPAYGYPPQHHPHQPQPHQPQPHQPQPRIDQVRAELDELSELLRKEPRDQDGQRQGPQDGQGGTPR
ncbi:hypothetical protein ACH4SP_30815 [Streptomyces sp. NPDC021093]|uniref:hypothetical protein n=1 Tax=Streptomyces sp. NPDC021093 TaxID=3365112 RepID=UPI0037AE1F64